MLETIRRLALGLFLLALSAAVLLYTDRGSRRHPAKAAAGAASSGKVFRVALVQHASVPPLEDGAHGVLEALAQRGYSDGGRISVKRYNAESDIGTANAIGKEVTSGGYDLIVSVSTISLQTIANANKFGRRTPHVFGLVTDPYAAGVGIEATNHAIHPAYMAGYGCMQPVETIFRTALSMRPELKSVGLVWNPAEANSLAQTKAARKVCSNLGIHLVEANAENSTAAVESVHSLISRDVEAIWISGDITVSLAADMIINAARQANIPVFSSMPPTVKRGALFDLGANYTEVGRGIGALAAEVLDGKDTAGIPVENKVPELFFFNETVLAGLKQRWSIPAPVRQRAKGWITATETNLPAASPLASAAEPRAKSGRVYKIGLAYFAPEAGAKSCIRGVFDGLRELGFEEGKNLEVQRAHAQGEIANIPLILQNFDSSTVDLVLPMSTPVISGACGLVHRKPVVFTYCSDPVAAGAGTSFANHLPQVTGVGSFPPVQDMVDFIHKTLPAAKTIGTIYNASEANSVKVEEVARGLFAAAGIKLDEITIGSSAEVLQAAQALVSRRVDAFYIQGDNTVSQGFDAVVKAAQDGKIPLFVDDPDTARRGATACIGLGYYRPGYAAAKKIARVLLGESPSGIPIENVSEKAVWLDLAQAERLGFKFPDDILAEAERARTGASPESPAPASSTPHLKSK